MRQRGKGFAESPRRRACQIHGLVVCSERLAMNQETTRRNFLKVSSGAAFAMTSAIRFPSGFAVAADVADQPWYRSAWRRAVIDMHIPDWDQNFLSEFDPHEYANMLERSRAQSIVCLRMSGKGFSRTIRILPKHGGRTSKIAPNTVLALSLSLVPIPRFPLGRPRKHAKSYASLR